MSCWQVGMPDMEATGKRVSDVGLWWIYILFLEVIILGKCKTYQIFLMS